MDIKIRRYYWAVLFLCLTIFSLVCFFGDAMIVPYSSDAGYQENLSKVTIENNVDLFDDSVIHDIEIELDRDDYESMLETYEQTDLKDYFKTDVVIDGVTVKDVGIRLKGQMTLQQAFRGSEDLESMELPFLIKFDKYVDGQNYEGITELAVRRGSSETLLEEPLALYAHKVSGEVIPEYSYASVTVSDLDPIYYEICENIDESFLEKYFGDSEGVLYKAGNFVDLTYKGNDQTEYMEDFEQKTQVNDADFSYLIDFLKFVNESTDQEFEEELPKRLDLDSFITMMAVNDLVENSDSFSGMNSNYYLYYSPETKMFTILPWDMNLAFGAMMGQGNMQRGGAFENLNTTFNRTGGNPGNFNRIGANSSGGMGEMGLPQGEAGNFSNVPEGMQIPQQGVGGNFSAVPEGMQMGEMQIPQGEGGNFSNVPEEMKGGMQMPKGDRGNFSAAPEGMQNENLKPGGVQRGERGKQNNAANVLKERFFENENFSAMYEERYSEIADNIYRKNLLLTELSKISETFTEYNSKANLLDQEDYDSEVEDMKSYIEDKNESLQL